MKKILKIQYNRKKNILPFELKKKVLKNIIIDDNINTLIREFAIKNYNIYSKKSKKYKLKNYCIITGQTRSVFRISNISRMKFKELILAGYFDGIVK